MSHHGLVIGLVLSKLASCRLGPRLVIVIAISTPYAQTIYSAQLLCSNIFNNSNSDWQPGALGSIKKKGGQSRRRTRPPFVTPARKFAFQRNQVNPQAAADFRPEPLGSAHPEIIGSLVVSRKAISQTEKDRLQDLARTRLQEVLQNFLQQGLSIRTPAVLVVIEAHPQALLLGDPEKPTTPLYARRELFPTTQKPTSPLYTIDEQGKMAWLGETDIIRNQQPKLLILTALTPNTHSLTEDFMLYHEIAHLTEPLGVNISRTLREARADFLAGALTGLTELTYPAELDSPKFAPRLSKLDKDKVKSNTQHERSLMRSLVNPSVATVKDLVIDINAYHQNSQVLASTFYDIAQSFGIDRARNLIHWLINLPEDMIPNLASRPSQPIAGEQREKTSFVMPTNVAEEEKATAKLIRQEFYNFGSLIWYWAKQGNLTSLQRDELKKILKRKGLKKSLGEILFND